MVRAGDMRHRVRLEVRSSERNSAGGQVDQWTTVATVWAAVQRTPGREMFASAGREERVPTVFRIRYRSDVTSAMRIVFGGKLHEILSVVDQEGRGEELLISTEQLEEAAA